MDLIDCVSFKLIVIPAPCKKERMATFALFAQTIRCLVGFQNGIYVTIKLKFIKMLFPLLLLQRNLIKKKTKINFGSV